jgi:hypothetical protein
MKVVLDAMHTMARRRVALASAFEIPDLTPILRLPPTSSSLDL